MKLFFLIFFFYIRYTFILILFLFKENLWKLMLIVKQHPLRNCIFKSVAFWIIWKFILHRKNNEVINFNITKRNSVLVYIFFFFMSVYSYKKKKCIKKFTIKYYGIVRLFVSSSKTFLSLILRNISWFIFFFLLFLSMIFFYMPLQINKTYFFKILFLNFSFFF